MSTYYHKNAGSRAGTVGNHSTKYYSIPTSERKFEFQNPQKTNIELSGKCVQYQRPPISKERSNFRTVQIHEQPDSKRTLVPELAPEPIPMRSKSTNRIRYNKESDGFNYISNAPVRQRNKQTNPKIYKSFDFSDSAKPEPYRRTMKETTFTKYDTTSQISNLPGCIKRNQNEINDDNKPKVIPDSESHNLKMYRDYRSNISCLPGSMKNEQKENPHIKSSIKRFAENDIFNTKPNVVSNIPTQSTIGNSNNSFSNSNRGNQNSFNTYCNKRGTHNTLFGDYNSNNNNYNNEPSMGIKRYNMKNRSQIQIL